MCGGERGIRGGGSVCGGEGEGLLKYGHLDR